MKTLFFLLISISAAGQTITIQTDGSDGETLMRLSQPTACMVNHMGGKCESWPDIDFEGIAQQTAKNTNEDLSAELAELRNRILELEKMMLELINQMKK